MFQRIKVLEIDLCEPTVAIKGLDGYAALRGLVRLHGTPLGYVNLPLTNGRCDAATLRNAILEQLQWPTTRQHLVNLLQQPLEAPSVEALVAADVPPAYAGPWPSLTVVVCTRDRPADLALCLAALCALDYPNLDLLVVDNAPSNDASAQLVREHFPSVRYVREDRPGLDWARNRAILECRGKLLAYTDDDVVVDQGWARALARVFAENPGVMAVTGLVAPFELETEPQLAFENYGGFGRGFVQRWFGANIAGGEKAATNYAGTGQCGTGANMAYRRELFDQIGYFDPALDVGTVTNGGGDLDMFFRVLKAGFPLVYEPQALVWHRHRRDYPRFHAQMTNNGIGFYAYLVRNWLAFPDERVALFRLGVWWFWYWSVLRLLKSFIRQGGSSRAIIRAELQGSLVGLGRYQKARQHAKTLARPGDPPAHPSRGAQRPAGGLRPSSIAVRSVDLGEPLVALTDVTDVPDVRVFVQRKGQLLGSVDIANRYQPISVDRLRQVLAESLNMQLLADTGEDVGMLWQRASEAICTRYRLPQPAAVPALPAAVTVSVVVATRDRPDDLRDCLRSLTSQATLRPLEIIVVDNNPASGQTAPVVAAFPTVRLVTETRQGLSYARNAGIVVSTGAIVVMTDDDATMPPEWLEKLVAPFVRDEVMIVTGNVLPQQLETKAQHLFERYGGLGRGFVRREFTPAWFRANRRSAVRTWEIGATANAAFRATIFSHPQIGLLHEELGAGTPTGCSEDTYLFYKTLKAGYVAIYEPQAFVWHRHRRDMAGLRRQIYNYSKGHIAYHLVTFRNDGDWRVLSHMLIHIPSWYLRKLSQQLKASIRGRNDYPISLTLTEIAGNLAGPLALLQSRRRVSRVGRSAPYLPVAQRTPSEPALVQARSEATEVIV